LHCGICDYEPNLDEYYIHNIYNSDDIFHLVSRVYL
jgi:hypothetical protein